jgi:hypothetical protein
LLESAGFNDIDIEITRRYTATEAGLDRATLPADWQDADGRLASAFVRATKPMATVTEKVLIGAAAEAECCDSSCCSA